jgi:GT2 family glycosyltransferase
MELISILITTYNRCRFLGETLDRLIRMFGPELAKGTAEILVFNDASTDDTEQVCSSYNRHIRYLTATRNVGYIEARRRLITTARGTYLISLDDDSCFLDNDAMCWIRAAFATSPECAVIAANIAEPQRPGGQLPVSAVPLPVSSFVGCGHVLRADHIRQVGGYPQFLAGYGVEEKVLSLRLLNQDYQITLLPHLRVYHAKDTTQRPLIEQRAGAFVNELATVIYVYPLWLIPATILQKTVSRVLYDSRHQSIGALRLAIRKLPPAIRQAAGQRQPIRTQTLKRYYALRRAFIRESRIWQTNQACSTWPETLTMYDSSNASRQHFDHSSKPAEAGT